MTPVLTREDRMADYLAKGLTVADAGRAMNLTAGQTALVWRNIKKVMGAQAA